MQLEPEYQDIELIVVVPYSGHDARWEQRGKERLARRLSEKRTAIWQIMQTA